MGFFWQHLLQTHHVTEANKKARDRKKGDSTNVVIDNVSDEQFSCNNSESDIFVRFSGEYLKL